MFHVTPFSKLCMQELEKNDISKTVLCSPGMASTTPLQLYNSCEQAAVCAVSSVLHAGLTCYVFPPPHPNSSGQGNTDNHNKTVRDAMLGMTYQHRCSARSMYLSEVCIRVKCVKLCEVCPEWNLVFIDVPILPRAVSSHCEQFLRGSPGRAAFAEDFVSIASCTMSFGNSSKMPDGVDQCNKLCTDGKHW